MSRKSLTLVLITKPNEILLGYKKRGFGSYKWNGFGGKVEENESICEAAIRELKEECGLVVSANDLEQVGIINFEFVGDPVILEVHIFTSAKYEGQHFETEEMMPKWFKLQDIPFDEMWADDRLWFPLFLSGNKFQGYFLFQGHDVILKHTLEVVENF
ncbi:oxidized purine nucleoside triphosphate hydrolase-like [Daphnia carinata]|uniref:oxidized purine nucleoside triphosphate hydrolase-like n=1 Tax=Daphnia carinata TaxID=120202 RepID=UPI002869457B|nr:oxidized purine nucleoside triphosphate hydrolase-like [Daphnia carinata]